MPVAVHVSRRPLLPPSLPLLPRICSADFPPRSFLPGCGPATNSPLPPGRFIRSLFGITNPCTRLSTGFSIPPARPSGPATGLSPAAVPSLYTTHHILLRPQPSSSFGMPHNAVRLLRKSAWNTRYDVWWLLDLTEGRVWEYPHQLLYGDDAAAAKPVLIFAR